MFHEAWQGKRALAVIDSFHLKAFAVNGEVYTILAQYGERNLMRRLSWLE